MVGHVRMRARFDRLIEQLAFMLWLFVRSAIFYGAQIGLGREAAIMLGVAIMVLCFCAGWHLGADVLPRRS